MLQIFRNQSIIDSLMAPWHRSNKCAIHVKKMLGVHEETTFYFGDDGRVVKIAHSNANPANVTNTTLQSL